MKIDTLTAHFLFYQKVEKQIYFQNFLPRKVLCKITFTNTKYKVFKKVKIHSYLKLSKAMNYSNSLFIKVLLL